MSVTAEIRAWATGAIAPLQVPFGGATHDTIRVIRTAENLVADFGTGDTVEGLERVRGWHLQIYSRRADTLASGGDGQREYTLLARCYWSVEGRGASEAAFVAHVEAVAGALEADEAPAGITNVWSVGPAEIEEMDLTQFGTRLCHLARVRVPVVVNATIR